MIITGNNALLSIDGMHNITTVNGFVIQHNRALCQSLVDEFNETLSEDLHLTKKQITENDESC